MQKIVLVAIMCVAIIGIGLFVVYSTPPAKAVPSIHPLPIIKMKPVAGATTTGLNLPKNTPPIINNTAQRNITPVYRNLTIYRR